MIRIKRLDKGIKIGVDPRDYFNYKMMDDQDQATYRLKVYEIMESKGWEIEKLPTNRTEEYFLIDTTRGEVYTVYPRSELLGYCPIGWLVEHINFMGGMLEVEPTDKEELKQGGVEL